MNRRSFLGCLFLPSMMLSACAPDGAQPYKKTVAYPSGAQSFPVRINHFFGSVVLTEVPKRVVTLGIGADELALALGVLPVGIEVHPWGGNAQGYLPWLYDQVTAQGQALPETISFYPELDVEKIISLRPDLVLATQSGLNTALYHQLSSFVPVIAFPQQPWLTPLADQISMVAAALGQPKAGEALLREHQALLQQWRQRYAFAQGKTVAVVTASKNNPNVWSFLPGDLRVDSLVALGMQPITLSPKLKTQRDDFAVKLGWEHIDVLSQADVVINLLNSPQDAAATRAFPLYQSLPAVQRGADIMLLDAALVMSLTCGTPLSLSWGLPKLLPLLQAAVAHSEVAS